MDMNQIIPAATFLIIGACLSFVASALHIGIIMGGPVWYRFFGAGEEMATAADAGKVYPHIITFGIAVVLAIWGIYALSGAGVVPSLPFLKYALIGITTIYLIRGLVFYPLFASSDTYTKPFVTWSSLICLGYGLVHGIGLYAMWATL